MCLCRHRSPLRVFGVRWWVYAYVLAEMPERLPRTPVQGR